MKRKILSLLLVLVLTISLCCPVWAAGLTDMDEEPYEETVYSQHEPAYGGEITQMAAILFDEGIDYEYDGDDFEMSLISFCVVFLLPLAVAFIVCQVFKSQMQTAKKQHTAHGYISGQGLNLTAQSDVFSHTTRSERRIKDDGK